MEIFLVIGLIVIVFALWGIRSDISNMQNSLSNIDSNLESLNERFNPPDINPYE